MKHSGKDTPTKGSDEETVEVAAVLGDGVHTLNRPHVVPTNESPIGGIEHDERGRARWQWKVDSAASSDPNAETFDYLRALDASLEIERSQKVRALASAKTGMDPYDTARLKKPK